MTVEQDPECPAYPYHGGVTVQTNEGLVCMECGKVVVFIEDEGISEIGA